MLALAFSASVERISTLKDPKSIAVGDWVPGGPLEIQTVLLNGSIR